jgi:hypothetical protein
MINDLIGQTGYLGLSDPTDMTGWPEQQSTPLA